MSALGHTRGRIPFAGRGEDFDWLTGTGLRVAADNPDNAFAAVLGLLAGCRPSTLPSTSEARGPSYDQLWALADALALTSEQGDAWELLAKSIPIAERHLLHILGALSKEAA